MTALLFAAAVAAPGSPLFAGVPPEAELGVAAPRVGEAAHGARAFLAAVGRRAPSAAPSRLGADFVRQLGVDLLDPKALEAAGLDPDGPLAYYTRGAGHGLSAAVKDPRRAEQHWRAWLLSQQGMRVVKLSHRGVSIHGATGGAAKEAHAAFAVAKGRVVVFRGSYRRTVETVQACLDALVAKRPHPPPLAALAEKQGDGPVRFFARGAWPQEGVAGRARAGPEGIEVDALLAGREGLLAEGPAWRLPGPRQAAPAGGEDAAGSALSEGIAALSASLGPLGRREAARLLAGPLGAKALEPLLDGPSFALVRGLTFDPGLARTPAARALALTRFAQVFRVTDPAAAQALLAGGIGAALLTGAEGDRVYVATDPASRDLALAGTAAAPAAPAPPLALWLDPSRLAAALSGLGLLDAARSDLFAALYALKLELTPLLTRTPPVTLTAHMTPRGPAARLRWPAPAP